MRQEIQCPGRPDDKATSPAESGYVDAAGHARLRDSIVGFLDILGFSQSIRTTTDPGESQFLVDRILAAITDARQYVRRDLAKDFSSYPNCWALKFFSDNLVVGYPVEGTGISPALAAHFIIRCAQRYQLRMALSGFFQRGALTRGPICLTDDLIFGAALLECYQLEVKASIVPRVILAEPLRDLVITSVRDRTNPMAAEAGRSICRDIDGWWFVSSLEAASKEGAIDWDLVERHKDAILHSLVGVTRHDVLPKFGWASRYHNMFCHWYRDVPGYSDRYRLGRADESSTICRLGDATEAIEA